MRVSRMIRTRPGRGIAESISRRWASKNGGHVDRGASGTAAAGRGVDRVVDRGGVSRVSYVSSSQGTETLRSTTRCINIHLYSGSLHNSPEHRVEPGPLTVVTCHSLYGPLATN